MRTLVLTIFCGIIFANSYAQKEKTKGNKIVVTEQKSLDTFHSIELYDDFEIYLREDSINHAAIEADSNLQEEISIEVIDNILKVKSKSDIKRSKKLEITISYAQTLKSISIHDKVQLKSSSLIESPKIRVESNDNSEVFLSIEADDITVIANGKTTAEFDIKANKAFYQVNDSGEIKGILDAEEFKIDLYQKGTSKLEGETDTIALRADRNTNFYGQKLEAKNVSSFTEGSSECYILVSDEITIEAKDTSEIYLLGDDPKIMINAFSDEAILYKKKKNYNPGLF